MKKQRKSGFLALIGLAAVASLFTVCKVHGSGGDYKGGDGEQVKVWKVTFDTAGGVPEPQPNPETVADGEAIGKLPDGPEKPPATFDGWYLGDTQFAASTPVTGDITLLAKWHEAPPGSVCVTFNGDGGEPGITNIDVLEGGTVSPLPGDPTRTGYTFGGWYTQTNGGGTPFTTGTVVPEAIIVYAKWTLVPTYGITLSNGDDTLDDTHGWTFTDAVYGYGAQTALSVTVANTGNQLTGNLTASADSGNFTITPSGSGAITSIGVGGTSAFTVKPNTELGAGTYTATVTVSGSNGIVKSFNVSFRVAIWLGGNWNPGWSAWSEDPVAADAFDPTSGLVDPGTKYTAPGDWIVIKDEDITTATTLTITVSDDTFGITGSVTTAKNVSAALATTGVKFEGVTGNRRVVVTGGNAALPLRLMLDGVAVSATISPIALESGADVIIVLAGANTLTATAGNGAGVRVPVGCTATITSVSAGTLTAQAHTYAAGIGGGKNEIGGTICIGGNATVISIALAVNDATGAAGIGGGYEGAGGTIIIGGSAKVTATGGRAAAGIGGGDGGGDGGTISICGNAEVIATANEERGGTGIGGGGGLFLGGAGGTISIGGNAKVTATGGPIIWSFGGAGIGGGTAGGAGGTISIGGNAQVTATGGGGGSYGAAGIGGSGGGTGGAGGTITIGGNARIVAIGGGDDDRGGAGIGGGNRGAGGTISISGGVVFARTGGAASRAAAIGAGGYAAESYAAGKITISGGFVAAQSENPATPDIGASEGYTGDWDNDTNSVTITGGSVYAAKAMIYPAPRNAGGTAVYPLYAPGALAGYKTINVTSPAYSASTIGKTAARFLTTGLFTAVGADQFPTDAVTDLDGLFPAAISATLWLPAASYTGITANGAGNYAANVTAVVVPYSEGGNNRLLQ